jgi:hypothetical protein
MHYECNRKFLNIVIFQDTAAPFFLAVVAQSLPNEPLQAEYVEDIPKNDLENFQRHGKASWNSLPVIKIIKSTVKVYL